MIFLSKLRIIGIALTKRCNLNCTHCGYNHKNIKEETEKSAKFFLDILEEAKHLGADMVNVTGGEVFLRSDCMDLINGAIAKGYMVNIESNGTIIAEEQISQLATHKKLVNLAISLDGFSSEIHDSIRGRGSFDKTMECLRSMAFHGVNARINTVMQNVNIEDIPKIARYAVEDLGMGFRLLPFILEYGKGVYACNTIGVQYKKMEELLNNFFFDFIRNHKQDNITVELSPALAPLDIYNHHVCPWGKAMLGIGPEGKVSLCHVSNDDNRFLFGDLTKESISKIWSSNDVLNKFRNLNYDELLGICGNCLARKVCRGGCRLHAISKYGDFLAPDPQCQVIYNLGKFPDHAIDRLLEDSTYGI